MKWVVRFLAVIGVVALVAVVALAIGLWAASRPAGEAAPASSADQASAGGSQIGSVDLSASRVTSAGGTVTLEGLKGTGVVPFATVAAESGRDMTLAHDGQGRVRMATTVEALGRTLDVSAVGDVDGEGRDIVIHPVSIDTGAPDALDAAVGSVARSALTIRRPLDNLPAGVSIDDLAVADDGFHVRVVGDRVALGG